MVVPLTDRPDEPTEAGGQGANAPAPLRRPAILLVLLGGLAAAQALVPAVAGAVTWRYQEDPDDEWASPDHPTGGFNYYVSYDKPAAALGAVWRTRHGGYSPWDLPHDNPIPPQCWTADPSRLLLRLYSNSNDGTGHAESAGECFDGTQWVRVGPLVESGFGGTGTDATQQLMTDGDWDTFCVWNEIGPYNSTWQTDHSNQAARWYEEAVLWQLPDDVGGYQYQEDPDGQWVNSDHWLSGFWYYVSYDKPAAATEARWLVKHGGLDPYYIAIPPECWDADPDRLLLRLYSNSNDGGGHSRSGGECSSGTGWIQAGPVPEAPFGGFGTAASPALMTDGDWSTHSVWNEIGPVSSTWQTNHTNAVARWYEEAMLWRVPSATGTLGPASLAPATGGTQTPFTFSVTYTNGANAAPQYAYLVVVGLNGSMDWQPATTADHYYADGSLFTCTRTLPPGTFRYFFEFMSDGHLLQAAGDGPRVEGALPPTLRNPSLTPATGGTQTPFTFSVTYTHGANVAPQYAYLVVVGLNGSMDWQPATTADHYYADGSLFTCTRTLPPGTFRYFFEFMSDGRLLQAAGDGPQVEGVLPPSLRNPSVSPATGGPQTPFTFSVTYTNGANAAPEYAYLVVIGQDGSMDWQPATTADHYHADGSLYTCTRTLPPGTFRYFFEFMSDGQLLQAAGAGPQVEGALPPSLRNPSLSPATGDAQTLFTFAVTYTSTANTAPQYAYLVVVGIDGSTDWQPATTADHYYIDGSLYTCTRTLPPGTFRYFFEFVSDGRLLQAAGDGPQVEGALPTSLRNPSLAPATGGPQTLFTFAVTYTSSANAAPQYAYLVVVAPDGSMDWKTAATVDHYYADGSLYTCTRTLPVGVYRYFFELFGDGRLLQAAGNGPVVTNP